MITQAEIEELHHIQDLAWKMIPHPYRVLYEVFGIVQTTTSSPVRRAALMLINLRAGRLVNQPLPSQRHFDGNVRLWTHWREQFPDDPEVLAVIDRALSGLHVADPAKLGFWGNPYDPVTGERLPQPAITGRRESA